MEEKESVKPKCTAELLAELKLTQGQYEALSDADYLQYEAMPEEEREQYKYFMGFVTHTAELRVTSNKEIKLYQEKCDTIQLKTVAQLLNFVPHKGQQPIFYTYDVQKDIYNNLVLVLGRRTGKSASTSIIAVKELLIPFSSTILLTPTFNNAKIIFNETLKHVQALKLEIKSINKGSFRFELANGARFSANSASNIESALGTANSLLLCDESQSIPNLEDIMNQMLVPTLLDYGTRPSGILYGRQIYLGTPRGPDNQLYDLFCKQDDFPNWKSFSAPSSSNPILPQTYFEQMRLELGEMLYNQEIMAQFIGTDDNVFYALSDENLYETGSVKFSKYTDVIVGIDVGFRDSTAAVFLYRDPRGNYYIDKAYSESMKATSVHVASMKSLEKELIGTVDLRYMDPAAAQLIYDYITDYDYQVSPAKNPVQESIKYINQLLTCTGANNKPRLFINSELKELLRQLKRVRWKDTANKTAKDPFTKDPKGTHWDLIAALRYVLFSDQHNTAAGCIIVA